MHSLTPNNIRAFLYSSQRYFYIELIKLMYMSKRPRRRVILDDLLVIKKKNPRRKVFIDHYLIRRRK